MKNNNGVIIAAIILSLAIIFMTAYIGNAIKDLAKAEQEEPLVSESLLMKDTEAAKYLGLSVENFTSIIKRQNIEKQNLTSYPTYKFIPYIEIDGVRYFSAIELQQWVTYNMHNK